MTDTTKAYADKLEKSRNVAIDTGSNKDYDYSAHEMIVRKQVRNLENEYGKNDERHTYFIDSSDLRVRAIFDFWAFIELIQFKGGVDAFATIHHELVEFNARTQRIDPTHRRKVNLIPRGHLKSTLNTVARVLWRIYRNENIRLCVATATRELALQFVREVKQYLEDEDLQEHVWNNRPHRSGVRLVPILDKAGYSRRNKRWDLGTYTEAEDKKIVWRADAIQVNRSQRLKEPTVIASSPGSNLTGLHFDEVYLDDIINDDTVATPEKIEKTLNWAQDLESIIDPTRSQEIGIIDSSTTIRELVGDEITINGTRYAKGDYYEYLTENKDYLKYAIFYRNVYRNQVDDLRGFLWSERFNAEVIDGLKRRLTPRRFASQYLNKCIAQEDIVLEREKLRYFRPDLLEWYGNAWRLQVFNELTQKDEYVNIKPYLVIDPAISQKKTADNSVIMVGGVDHLRNLYIFDFYCGKLLPDSLIDRTYGLADKWNLTAINIEVIGFQQSLVYIFRSRFAAYRPLGLLEYKPRGEKKARIETNLHPLFNNSKVYAPIWAKTHAQLVEEIDYFPQAGTHDDILDAMSMLYEVACPTAPLKTKHRRIKDSFNVDKRYGGRLR